MPMPLPTFRRRTMLPTACGLLLAGTYWKWVIPASLKTRGLDAARGALSKMRRRLAWAG